MVLNIGTSIGYFQTDLENIENIRRITSMVKPNGKFIIEAVNPIEILNNFSSSETLSINSKKRIYQRYFDLKSATSIESVVDIFPNGRKIEYFSSIRLFFPHELIDIMLKSGFVLIDLLGDDLAKKIRLIQEDCGIFFKKKMFDFVQKMRFHKEKIRSLLDGRIEESLSTVFIDLVSGACNHNCIFCDGKFSGIDKVSFSKSKLLELSDDLADLGVNSVILVGEGGESLLNSDFEFFSKQLLDRDIHVGIYTNGGLLDRKNMDVISMFDFIRISLDSGSLKTHQLVHGYGDRDNFKVIFDSIKHLKNLSDIQIGASYILLPQNVKEIYAAAKKLKKAGADYLEIKPAYLKNYDFDFDAYQSIFKEFKEQLLKTQVLEDNHFKVLINNQLKNVIQNEDENLRLITKLPAKRICHTCKLRIVISPTGCYVCPPNRSKKDYRIGDIQKNSLKSIWNSRDHHEALSKECDLKCPYHEQNEFLAYMKNKNLKFEPELADLGSPVDQKYFL